MSLFDVSDSTVDGPGEGEPVQSMPTSPGAKEGQDGEANCKYSLITDNDWWRAQQDGTTWPTVSGANGTLQPPGVTTDRCFEKDGLEKSSARNAIRSNAWRNQGR